MTVFVDRCVVHIGVDKPNNNDFKFILWRESLTFPGIDGRYKLLMKDVFIEDFQNRMSYHPSTVENRLYYFVVFTDLILDLGRALHQPVHIREPFTTPVSTRSTNSVKKVISYLTS